jgi:hypothetical protein
MVVLRQKIQFKLKSIHLASYHPAAARRDRLVRAEPARAPAAGLGNPALRQLLAAPGPDLRAPGDALRGQPRRADILLVPASTAVYRLAPPAFLAAYTFFLKKGEKLDVPRSSAAR